MFFFVHVLTEDKFFYNKAIAGQTAEPNYQIG